MIEEADSQTPTARPTRLPASAGSGDERLQNLLFKTHDARDRHKRSISCEHPRTCGACHFYSGAIEALSEILTGQAGIRERFASVEQIRWEYEDELPDLSDDDFTKMFESSKVDGVRLYPFIDVNGRKVFIWGDALHQNAPAMPSASDRRPQI